MTRGREWIGFAVFAVLLAGFPLVAPESIVDIGVYALIYGLAALGLSLLMGLAGQVNLGQAAFFAIGAYSQGMLVTRYGVEVPVAAVVAVALAMLAALLVGLPLLRLRGHYLALATLGLGIIVTVAATESDYLGATSGIYGIAKPEFGGRRYDSAAEFFWLLAPVMFSPCCSRATSSPGGSAARWVPSTTPRWRPSASVPTRSACGCRSSCSRRPTPALPGWRTCTGSAS
jgi:branched-chain amino acid transport system permease protein